MNTRSEAPLFRAGAAGSTDSAGTVMMQRERRRQAMERLLGEIRHGARRGDRVATMVHIHEARRRGEITDRDAQRLVSVLVALVGDPVGALGH